MAAKDNGAKLYVAAYPCLSTNRCGGPDIERLLQGATNPTKNFVVLPLAVEISRRRIQKGGHAIFAMTCTYRNLVTRFLLRNWFDCLQKCDNLCAHTIFPEIRHSVATFSWLCAKRDFVALW